MTTYLRAPANFQVRQDSRKITCDTQSKRVLHLCITGREKVWLARKTSGKKVSQIPQENPRPDAQSAMVGGEKHRETFLFQRNVSVAGSIEVQ